MASKHMHESEDIPSDLRDLASQISAIPGDAPEALEARAFEASVVALREGRANTGVIGRIGFLRWMAPIAAAAAVGLLAWAGATWLVPASTNPTQPDRVTTVALDEHVSEALEYADLFSDTSWSDTLAEDAEQLDEAWRPTVEAWSFGGDSASSELGAG